MARLTSMTFLAGKTNEATSVKFIDEAGLADATIPITIYAKALGIEGYCVRPEERDVLLRTLSVYPPEAGSVAIYTGPGVSRYWAGAPPSVRVFVMPAGTEIPASSRSEGIEWVLSKAGVPRSEAKALSTKAPTAKHKHFEAYISALQEWQAWGLLAAPCETAGELAAHFEWAYLGDFEPPSETRPYEYVLVDNVKALRNLGLDLQDASANGAVVGLDVESDEDENYEAELVGISIAFYAEQAQDDDGISGSVSYYLPVNGALGPDIVRSFLALHFLEHEVPPFIAHNAKFDCQVLAKYLAPNNPLTVLRRLTNKIAGDGLIAAYVNAKVDYATGRAQAKDLKFLADLHFGVEMLHFADMLALSGATRASEAPLSDIGPYCAADAYWGVKVWEYELYELRRYPKLLALYEKVELPTVKLVAEMEMLGLKLDYALLEKRRKEVTARVEVYRRYLEKQAVRAGYELTTKTKSCPLHDRKKVSYAACPACDDRGRVQVTLPFNPGSRLQVEAVLQGTFRLPRMASTEGGDASNNEPALLRLREFTSSDDAKDWITFLLAWRKDDKVRGTYLDGLWERKRHDSWQGEAWYVHPKFNQAVVESGRFSSKDPNGQNIPLNMRDLFVA